MKAATRRRRTADDAKRAILDAAERRLIAGGPEAVRVQAVARDLGITDAAIHHHFRGREGLIEAMMRDAARRLNVRFNQAMEQWQPDTFDVHALAQVIREIYVERGYARLVAWMVLAGWQAQDAPRGLYQPLAEAIHAARVRQARQRGSAEPALEDTLYAVTLLNLVLFAEPLVGTGMLRGMGLPPDQETADRLREWLVDLLERHLRS